MADKILDKSARTGETTRRAGEIIAALQSIIDDVIDGKLFGDFGVTFTAQNGTIGHHKELRHSVHK